MSAIRRRIRHSNVHLSLIRLVGLDMREPHRDVAHGALRVFDSVCIETPVLAVAGGSAVGPSVTSVPVDRASVGDAVL